MFHGHFFSTKLEKFIEDDYEFRLAAIEGFDGHTNEAILKTTCLKLESMMTEQRNWYHH